MAAPLTALPPAPPPPSALQEIGVNLIDDPGLWFDEVIGELTLALKTFLPNLLGAVALLLIGWLAAFLVRWLILRFGKGLDAILAAVHRRLGQEVAQTRWSISTLVGNVSFWMTLAYAVSAAAEQIGLNTFASWVLGLLGYLPSLLISLFILFIGYLVAGGVRNLIVAIAESRGFQHGLSLGHLAAGLILAFALLLGLAQLGLDVTLFADIILLAAAALFASAALAFGIGASDAVRNVMASHYVRRAYRTGQQVRVDGLQGEILELTQVAVIVDTVDGEAWIPARRFLENVALIIEEDDGEHD
ncbi:MAG: mechanosensitive ion channel [Gammaproteobacteria bacterium]|nr:mechanosensitive ion channel [Gammaproteobacteria bacterium]MCP5317878.1 mechanosensitive ion channel [Chromatiaceae bacterium]MCB1817910.1 mechanosensitive ion channel [Gammaproteobacteria bacterium]MCP5429110.1 mechanosensitive ion channel [Chromatiaceae bacterium]MCP5434650.1 mechanosensitive ion channel [Chromatiaceae bacterium]